MKLNYNVDFKLLFQKNFILYFFVTLFSIILSYPNYIKGVFSAIFASLFYYFFHYLMHKDVPIINFIWKLHIKYQLSPRT